MCLHKYSYQIIWFYSVSNQPQGINMQTITVNLNALAVAQGFRLLTDSERIEFLDALMHEYSGDYAQLLGDLEKMALDAHRYSDDAGRAAFAFGEAFSNE